LPVFQEHPWLLFLCYAIAAMAIVYAVQLQLSLRPGAKPARGIVVWREDLQDATEAKLRAISGEGHYITSNEKGVTIETQVTPEEGGLFLHVRKSRRNSPPAPYNATVGLGAGKGSIGFRLSPLVPLIYIGLIIIVFMIMEGGWFSWAFISLVALLMLFTIGNMRGVVMEAIRGVSESNRVVATPAIVETNDAP
jgi:hypothetical protein